MNGGEICMKLYPKNFKIASLMHVVFSFIFFVSYSILKKRNEFKLPIGMD